MGKVYLLGDWAKEGYYKIGVTKGDVEKRIKKLQTGNGGEIYLISYFETDFPFELEKMLHNRYQHTETHNEWFEMTNEEVGGFQKACEEFQESLDALRENYFFKKKNKK